MQVFFARRLIELSNSLSGNFFCCGTWSSARSHQGIFVATTQCSKAFVPHPFAVICVSGFVDKRCQTERWTWPAMSSQGCS